MMKDNQKVPTSSEIFLDLSELKNLNFLIDRVLDLLGED